jgi:hypothetical protein
MRNGLDTVRASNKPWRSTLFEKDTQMMMRELWL